MINNIMKIFIVFAILFLTIGLSSGESISGYVTDSNGLPVNTVEISDNASVGNTNTNSTGYYYINGYTNLSTYILTTSKSGYIDNTLSVDVNGNITNANITITEKSQLYDLWDLLKQILNNAGLIIGLIIVSVILSMVVAFGLWLNKLLPSGKK